jgi:hypothetical protein
LEEDLLSLNAAVDRIVEKRDIDVLYAFGASTMVE